MKRKILTAVLVLTIAVFCAGAMTGCGDSENRAHYDTVQLSFAGIGERYDIDTWIGDEISDRVAKRTDGRVLIVFYDNEQLGTAENLYKEMVSGNVDMALVPVYEDQNAKASIVYLPFLTTDYDDFKKVYAPDTDLFKYVEKAHRANGLTLLGFWTHGYAGVGLTETHSSKEAYFDPTSKNQETVRTPNLAVVDQTLKTIGFATKVYTMGDTYRAMRDGEVEGALVSGAYQNYMLYRDLLKYYIDYRMISDVYSCLINTEALDQLSPEDMQILIDTSREVLDEAIDKTNAKETEALKDLSDAGITVLTPSMDQRQYMKQYYRENVWPALTTSYDAHLLEALREQQDMHDEESNENAPQVVRDVDDNVQDAEQQKEDEQKKENEEGN